VKRTVLAVALATALAASCTGGGSPSDRTTGPEPTATPGASASPTSSADETGSAAAALERLCSLKVPKPGGEGSDVPPEGPTPPAIQQVMDELEQIRGFSFDHPVVADPVTRRGFASRSTRASLRI
jgi:hypothetical protein